MSQADLSGLRAPRWGLAREAVEGPQAEIGCGRCALGGS